MTVQVTRQFRHQWDIFWATTYTFDPRMFEDFWLPRLGDAPLNVTLLVDFNRLATTWDNIESERAWRLRRANRDYLIRGVRPTAGAFHPKTYFFANERDGLLLVGSGNLTLGGIEKGHEVFCCFESHDPDGLAALRGWYEWMDSLVKRVNDLLVSSRWVDLRGRASWLRDATASSLFVSNWERSLLEQIAAAFPSPVDELHVMAPFYDPQAQALAAIISAAKPRQIHVYIGKDVSVDGTCLSAVLQSRDCEVTIHGFEPAEFVHAKLIGIVSGDRGRLLSGSANLSLAALSATVVEGKGNVEAGVLVDIAADRVRSAFSPAGLGLVDMALHDLSILRFQPSKGSVPYPLALHSATREPDGRVKPVFSGQASAADLFLSSGASLWRIRDGRTADPLAGDGAGQLVWLTDGQNNRLSNAVPIDDPERLAQALQDRSTRSMDRPRELDEGDLNTSVGAMLQRLHNACILDIDETPALTKARAIAEESDDPDFWDRLAQEELRLDPRMSSYSHRGFTRPSDENDVLNLLQRMRDRVSWHGQGLHPVHSNTSENASQSGGTGKPASPRLQVRLYNVLARWCRAVGDPRLRWIDPLAPTVNYTELLAAIAECWADKYFLAKGQIRIDRIAVLLETLFNSFIRGERTVGYLLSLNEAERERALAALLPSIRALAAGLVYLILRPSGPWRDYVFAWQSFLGPALEMHVLSVTDDTVTWIELLTGHKGSETDIRSRLDWATTFIDDSQWCATMQRDLDLGHLRFTSLTIDDGPDDATAHVVLHVEGVNDPLRDSRLVTLLRQALEYRKRRDLIIDLPAGRIVVELDVPAAARIDKVGYASSENVTLETIAALETRGAGWGAILKQAQMAAS